MKKHSSLLATLLIVGAIIVVLNYLVGSLNFFNARIDLTEKKLYTLSEGTKRVLLKIPPEKTPVTLRFYATRDSRIMPQVLDGYARTVQDLLMEFEKAGGGKVTLEKIDPRPDTEQEDKATGDDIAGHQANAAGDKFYLGLAIECLDKKEVIPSLSPGEESALEYEITRAISKVVNPKKPVIGVLSAMPIAGPAFNLPPQLMRQQQQQPWAIIQQLRFDYDVRSIPTNTASIDADVNIVILIHPADLQEKAEFALDQFVLRGGKIVAFVDPQCAVAANYNNQGNPMMGQQPSFTPPSSNLKNLFKAWGIGYDPDLVVADMTLRSGPAGRAIPTFLSLGNKFKNINHDEPFTAPLEMLQMFSAGAFTIDKKEGINATTLLESTESSMLIDGATAEKARREPLTSFQASGRKQILGLRLTGHFKTAFPDGPPKDKAPADAAPKFPGGTGGAQEDAGAPKTPEKNDAPTAPAAEAAKPAEAPKPAETPKPADTPKPAEAAKPQEAPKTADTPKPPPAAAPAPATAPATAAAPEKKDAKKEEPKPDFLKESARNDGIVFLFSDADMLFDAFCFQQDPLGRLVLLNHNVPLLLNIIEMLNGGTDLINVRSRGSTKREFTKIQELRNDVEKEFRPQIESLEKKRQDSIKEISSLKVTTDKEGNQVIVLSPEKKQQLARLQESEQQIIKELREVKKKQNSRIDWLENVITALNLLAVPALVILFGVTLAVRRRSMQAAK